MYFLNTKNGQLKTSTKGPLPELDALLPFPSCLPPAYQGAIARHADMGDVRLSRLAYHLSPASHDLWNFLMTEEERLHDARAAHQTIVGAMKDLGTIPILVDAFADAVAFYPDGAWWLPCFKEQQTCLLEATDALGIGEGFCPVRAMLGAFELKCHFPIPDLLVCSTGAICDDFKAIVQRLVERGHHIHFWQMPHVRDAENDEPALPLPNGRRVPAALRDIVEHGLRGVLQTLSTHLGETMTDDKLRDAIRRSNRVRTALSRIRNGNLPSLERLICEMLAIHYCSDYALCEKVLARLADESDALVPDETRKPVYWINPVADLRVMNILEDAGGRLCGTDFMFAHALALLDETVPPLQCLAEMALQDPMAAPTSARMQMCVQDAERLHANGIIVSRIPGASHCAFELLALAHMTSLPVLEIEVAPVTDPYAPSLLTRLQAFVENLRPASQ
ncbi:MAG: 2-hydroxyacyl-CoA dehydratase family protein [Kiritimatiellaeota bacterium]|nr:2-hydroxyacyl-CoA dehydratase family protein [Kiritimatiellota bacterium]